MIKIENVEVVGWEHVIRGMRNPKNSWELSDSECWEESSGYPYDEPKIGPNDHKLMMSLAKGGPVHAKYRRMIVIYLDITAPLYFWKEFDTYKLGTVANSCSTMHKIHAKEFTLDDFSCEHLLDFEEKGKLKFSPLGTLQNTIDELNNCREVYLETKDKKYWWQMIQLLPSSYNQKRTVMLNYEVLHNMYFSRRNHKLDEWREFCKWIESLPYSEIITARVRIEDDIHKDLIDGKISVNEARKEMGLEPIDTMVVFVKDFCIRYDVSEEKFNEIIYKIYSSPNLEEAKKCIEQIIK